MPDLPWNGREELRGGCRYTVEATYLRLARISATPRFVGAVIAICRQLAHADGLVGYTLRARPLAGDYWTLSIWRDANALRAFVAAAPHVTLMSSLRPVMGATAFARWEIDGGEPRPGWPAALARLAEGGRS